MIDEVSFKVKAGNGGNGAVSFHRAKYIPKGGPDGGDGGNGGSIWLGAEKGINTLSFFAGRDRFEANNGGKGSGSKRHGENAEDITLKVPVGTVVSEIISQLPIVNCQLISDLVEDRQKVCIAQGGVGGRGNFHFRSSVNTTPLEFEEGTRGEKKLIQLELKVLAQVGLVGLPNAGKSTLLSILTKAQPKIANYPFTTLTPNLGAMKLPGRQDHLVIADIPGLIEGASSGKGLGLSFLRHIERCRILLYLVAPTDEVLGGELTEKSLYTDLNRQYDEVRKELGMYKKELLDVPSMVVINKIDLLSEELAEKAAKKFASKKLTVLMLSAATGAGLQELVKEIDRQFTSLR